MIKKNFKKTLTKKENINTFIPSILTEMFALLKAGIQKMRNISVNSPNRLKTDAPAVILPQSSLRTDNKPFRKARTGIMSTKVPEIVKGHPNISSKDVLRLLSFSDAERDYVVSTTSMQWQCEEWYIHKAAFITTQRPLKK